MPDAVRFSTSGTLTSLGPPPSDPAAPGNIIESVVVQGTAGTAGLNAVNGSQSFDLPVAVVPLNGLSMLTAEVHGTYLGAGGGTVDSPVTWNVFSPTGQVFGATCAWSVSDSSVLIDNLQPANKLDLPPTGSVTFKMSRPGMFTATCTIGGLMVQIPLKRDS